MHTAFQMEDLFAAQTYIMRVIRRTLREFRKKSTTVFCVSYPTFINVSRVERKTRARSNE